MSYELEDRQYIAVLAGPQSNNPPGRLFIFALDEAGTVPAAKGS